MNSYIWFHLLVVGPLTLICVVSVAGHLVNTKPTGWAAAEPLLLAFSVPMGATMGYWGWRWVIATAPPTTVGPAVFLLGIMTIGGAMVGGVGIYLMLRAGITWWHWVTLDCAAYQEWQEQMGARSPFRAS